MRIGESIHGCTFYPHIFTHINAPPPARPPAPRTASDPPPQLPSKRRSNNQIGDAGAAALAAALAPLTALQRLSLAYVARPP